MKRTFRMVIVTAVTLLLSTVLSFIYFSNHSQPEKNACEHTYGEWIVERQATCKEEGLQSKTCTKCSRMVKKSIENTNDHTEVITPAVPATCQKAGLTKGTHCSVCEIVIVPQQVIPAVAHTYSDKYDASCNVCGSYRDAKCAHTEIETLKGKAATCTETGLTAGSKCKKCGEILTVQSVIPVIAHSYSATVTAPTCAAEGYTTYTCKCGDRYVADRIPKTAHSFGKWTTVKEATATEEGLQERACACGKKETQIIKKTGNQGSAGLEYTLSSDGKSYSVTGIGTCKDSRIVIPAKYNNLPVTTIGDGAFADYIRPTSVTIPDSVTTIGNRAFSGCDNLSSVTIPDSVTTIGEYAFFRCISLTSVTIGDGVTIIGNYAFSNCTRLTSVTIGDGLTTIGEYAFYKCTSLTSITFQGTMAQWEKISLASYWNYKVPATEVICSDGTVRLTQG